MWQQSPLQLAQLELEVGHETTFARDAAPATKANDVSMSLTRRARAKRRNHPKSLKPSPGRAQRRRCDALQQRHKAAWRCFTEVAVM
jgi:hypothetical protein